MSKKALITGITGQDGSYLTEFLLDKGYEVHGLVRRASVFNTDRIDHLYRDPHDPEARMFPHYGDFTDAAGLRRVLQRVMSDEVYNLGGGRKSNISVLEAAELAQEITGRKTPVGYTDKNRAGDHVWYVSDLTTLRSIVPVGASATAQRARSSKRSTNSTRRAGAPGG